MEVMYMQDRIDTLEAERACEETAKSDRMLIVANEQAIKYMKERDKLREQVKDLEAKALLEKGVKKLMREELEAARRIYTSAVKLCDWTHQMNESTECFVGTELIDVMTDTIGLTCADYKRRFGDRK
jgi:hypothetical protein